MAIAAGAEAERGLLHTSPQRGSVLRLIGDVAGFPGGRRDQPAVMGVQGVGHAELVAPMA